MGTGTLIVNLNLIIIMKKDSFSKFEGSIVQLETASKISGGQDPGYTTDTEKCTWNYNYMTGNASADTDKDGDWVDACGDDHTPVS